MIDKKILSCDCVIIGTGPAGLGAAFFLKEKIPEISIVMIDKEKMSSGGLINDCKMNFTFPVGFPLECWDKKSAEEYMLLVSKHLDPPLLPRQNIEIYRRRAERLSVELLEINQSHLGTDGGIFLAKKLVQELREIGVHVYTGETALDICEDERIIVTDKRKITFRYLILAVGRKGFSFLQAIMNKLKIHYIDNVVDIGIRIETREQHYPIVKDYYDPKFLFPDKVRTFCTNSNRAYVVREKYNGRSGRSYYSINGHAFSKKKTKNGLVNFALLKSVKLTQPLASGQEYAEMLGELVTLMGGGKPLMQRVGDFRLGKRSKSESFFGDLYDFEPTLKDCTPGDISLAMPARILRALWKSMKLLDTIVPGVMHPSTIMYYPEIKLYANKPQFVDSHFQAKSNIYLIGDGAGTSRGIVAAWASGIRAAEGIIERYF